MFARSVVFLVLVLALSCVAVAPAAGAADGALLISQQTNISATASACANGDCDSESSDDDNSDIGDWDGSATAHANVPGAFGFGEAQQDSKVSQGDGSIDVSTESDIDFSVGGSDSGKTVSGTASSVLDVQFNVTGTPVSYFVTGAFFEPADTADRESIVKLVCDGTTLVQVSSNTRQNFSESGTIGAGASCRLTVDGHGSTTDAANSDGGLSVGFGADPAAPAVCPDVQVGFATAKGCFLETAAGSGVFETAGKAWVGGFEIEPHDGGKLVVNTLDRRVSAQGSVDVVFEGSRLPIPVGALPVNVASGSFELNQVGTIEKVLFDLPMKGTAKVAWANGGRSASFEAALEVEKLTNPVGRLVTLSPGERVEDVSGKLKASLSNGTGFQIDSAEVGIAKLDVLPRGLNGGRVLGLRNILLRFERRDGRPFWTGQAGISFPMTRGDLTVTGKVFVFDRALAGGGLAVDGINRPIPDTPLFFQRVSGDLLFSPRFGYAFGVGATLGPQVRGKTLFKIDADMKGGSLATDCPGGPYPTSMTFTGSIPPVDSVGQAKVTGRACYFAGDDPGMEVTTQIKTSLFGGVLGYEGSMTGLVSTNGANLEGRVLQRLPGPDLQGQAIISTQGTAACGSIGFADIGFGYRWGDSAPAPFTACDLAPFRVTVSSAALRARAATVLRVPGGLPHAAFAATAVGGAPRVKVTGPGGFSLTSPADGTTLRNGRAYVVSDPEGRTTYVIVNDPRAGAWHVNSTDPAHPLTKVRFAAGLPKPKITARVRKTPTGARLTYRIKSIPGQTVTFTERGPGIAHRLGRARGRRGSINFKPTVATSRKRTIEAAVIQNGLPRTQLTVARFKASAQAKLTRPHVKSKRTKTTLTLSWPGVAGASNYLVEIRSAAGALLGPLLSTKRRLTLKPAPAKGNLSVTVQALNTTQLAGPIAKETIKAAAR